MYRQVQCLYCPSGCRHRLRSRPCMHGPGAAASLQVSARTRAPFSRAPGLGDTWGMCALSLPHGCPPTALSGREPTQPEGMCSATLSGNKPAAAERPRGPARGTAGPWAPGGAEPQLGNRGRLDRVGGERGQGSGAICSSPARVPVGWGPAHTGTSTAGNGRGAAAGLAPVELESVVGARAVPGFPPSPARGTSRRDGDGNGAPHRHCHLPPAARPPGPCPTEGSPPGPRSPRWGCQGLCSGEYRHFTLNIKRRNRVCHIQESERG